MLNRIKIRGYKSLRDVEVRLQPLSVLFGPNAAGKSNFLDALQLLSKTASSRTLKEAFEPPYRGKPLESFSFPENGLKGLLAQGSARFRIEADFTLSKAVVDGVNKQVRDLRRPSDSGSSSASTPERAQEAVRERDLRYCIEIEMLPKSGILRVVDEYLAALNRKGEPTGNRDPFLSRRDNRLHLRLEGQAHPTYLDLYLDHSILSLPHYPPYYPHLVAARQELESWLFFYFEPRERMRAANPVKEVRHIGLMGEELPAYLNTLKALEPRQFGAVEKALHTILPQIESIDVEVNDLGEVELRLKEAGILIPARVLSEGTLRILGMLALTGAKEPPSLVGFEEPENGIHPRRIELIAEFLKTRSSLGQTQYIVTTHSPILPDLIPDDSLFVVQKSESGTGIEPLTTYGNLGELTRKRDIDLALKDRKEEHLLVSERLLRGDFDA
ncbi:MAG: AAA family ATPase [Methylacidiphilaceae bacterium]|nr:AAA family ATPase [Candidatus Methylacidiphilaceae bacterium]